MPLAEKVKEGIDEATFFVPILTGDSISNQWVNQEIGFAEAKGVSILPVVEQEIIPRLKGFIHNQVDLSLFYKGSNNQPRKEAASFRRCYRKLIDLLLNTESDTFTSTISPKRVREGEPYITTVHFRGKVQNGFFDNKVVHMDSGFVTWNWDDETLADEKSTTPGILNGTVDVR